MEGCCFSSGTTSASTASGANDSGTISTSMIIQQLSTSTLNAAEVPTVQPRKLEKDPRQIARKYQMELCMKALEENVVVYLETGCGKTHIAILLIYEMGHLIKKPQKNICIFLAPTVALVQQQAKVIEDSVDFKVGTYCGSSKRLKNHHDWEKEMEEYEVFVMTPQILLHNLSHCLIRMELIALLIFDECHYAQLESNHPYAEIMKVFYKADVVKLPRIFGMTASPILGKAASVDGLETLLRAKVYSVEDRDELEKFVSSPKVNIHYYDPTINGSSGHLIYCRKLEEIKHQCVLALSGSAGDHNILLSTKKMLQKLHGNLIFCLENLGLWGALQACHILLKGDRYELNELMDADGNCADDSLCDRYLTQAAQILASICTKDTVEPDLSKVEVLKEPFFSRKLLCLIGILRNFRLQPNMKCIIFVNRIMTARSLSYILRNLRFLGFWRCDFLLGVNSGLKSMSRKNTNVILERFRSGEVNLLVATKVGEEGLDIQTCCLVIRFDLPETVASFIQSRGRARMPQSEYAFVVNRGNEKELNLIKHFIKEETQMNEEILSRKSQVTITDFEEDVYKVDLTGATISSASSVSLLHRYCSKLPHDEFFNPMPLFFYFEDSDGMVCQIILPPNAPIHQIVSTPQPSSDAAKRNACLKACKSLHEFGALTDYLLPEQDDANDELDSDFSDSESCNDENSRRELHEMLVPTALKQCWTESDNPVTLSSYYFKFSPNPVDRDYRKFGLFLKAPLPKEAEKMRLDLLLDRGRSVLTELIPFGVSFFEKDELVRAKKFQRMFFKVILDRSEFIPEIVSLDDGGDSNMCSSTVYLLLPLLFTEDNKISVDWNLITRCLSSPIFGAPGDTATDGTSHRHLHLANGVRSFEDVINSLVYVPSKDTFFFISDVVTQRNGYNAMKDKDSKTHVEHYEKGFGIRLAYPDQPLLKAKQLFCLDNLLRKKGYSEIREKVEHFIELPPEICQLKIIGFSKDIGSSLSVLPSFMHRLESLLVAIELKDKLSESFPEGAEVTVQRILEALTTEKCGEHFSLERLEVLGDAFLKFAVGRHLFLLHDTLDEGQLTRKRSSIVNNSNLLNLVTRKNLQVYIRDQSFEPGQFYALGHPCRVICTEETEKEIHSSQTNSENSEVRCNKCHHWLHKKTIADMFEALVGAFIVDSGFKAATAFLKWMGIQIDFKDSQVSNVCCASTNFLPLANQLDINALENLLGYHFVHKGLLIQAFLHPSFSNHLGGCYQRLEFLGDAVLDYLITSYLYSVYPKLKPGQFTDLRSAFVNNNSFADVAIHHSFHKFIISDSSDLSQSMGKYASFQRSATENGNVQEPSCPKALGDLVESCMGAILLDKGFDLNYVWKMMLSLLKPVMSLTKLRINPIRDFIELCQSHNLDHKFSSSKLDGIFTVIAKAVSDSMSVNANATNASKKAAKRMAAHKLFSYLKGHGYRCKSKPLVEILKECEKMEAQLIGYDETPSIVSPKLYDLQLQEDSKSDFDFKVRPLNEIPQRNSSTKYKDVVPRDPSFGASGLKPREQQPLETINGALISDSQELGNKPAKARLYEICASNYWKPPAFECCEETGPSHLPEFTFKVVVEIDDVSHKTLECYGECRTTKKAAAEHAAEGALWYLKHEGYLRDKI